MDLKSMVKKNQVMITALAVMIAAAGYLHFAGEASEEVLETSAEVSDETLISDQLTIEDLLDEYDSTVLSDITDEDLEQAALMEELDTQTDVELENYSEDVMTSVEPESDEIPGETVYTSSTGVATINDAKLLKEQTRAKNEESLYSIIESTEVTDELKAEAVQDILAMTNRAEMETGAEILLQAKGFSDCIVSISDTGVDVVINAASLTDAQLAQIEDIVKRKTGVGADEIVISTVATD
ncbi:MAG: SpoIIIAH-like family protein [Lachnospiraceae bacterium]|nr:SpoIIIAH-like family protein [Lachnospiraceae bacterium]